MPRPPKISISEIYESYYYYYEAPETERLSQSQIVQKLNLPVGQETLSRQLAKYHDTIFPQNQAEYENYKNYIAQIKEVKYLLKIVEKPDGGIEFQSPYPWIVDYCNRGYARSKNKPKYLYNLRRRISLATGIWEMLGRTNPNNWTEKEVNFILTKVTEKSRFNSVCAMRMISPPLKAISGLTMTLKAEPRTLAILSSPEFPSLFKKILASAINNAKDEREKDEINFIVNVKAMTGIRTGKRQFEQGLWGSRIAEGKSFLQVLEKDFVWHVYEKKEEEWDINFKPPMLVNIVNNYVRKWALKKGDWVISIEPSRAGQLLRQACIENNVTELKLHDLRKVYVSYLVRAGIPLERAIRLNVGWKDIGTANKHYLMFSSIWEDVSEKLSKFSGFF